MTLSACLPELVLAYVGGVAGLVHTPPVEPVDGAYICRKLASSCVIEMSCEASLSFSLAGISVCRRAMSLRMKSQTESFCARTFCGSVPVGSVPPKMRPNTFNGDVSGYCGCRRCKTSDPAMGALYDSTRGATWFRSERASAPSCNNPNFVASVWVGPPSTGDLSRSSQSMDAPPAAQSCWVPPFPKALTPVMTATSPPSWVFWPDGVTRLRPSNHAHVLLQRRGGGVEGRGLERQREAARRGGGVGPPGAEPGTASERMVDDEEAQGRSLTLGARLDGAQQR